MADEKRAPELLGIFVERNSPEGQSEVDYKSTPEHIKQDAEARRLVEEYAARPDCCWCEVLAGVRMMIKMNEAITSITAKLGDISGDAEGAPSMTSTQVDKSLPVS